MNYGTRPLLITLSAAFPRVLLLRSLRPSWRRFPGFIEAFQLLLISFSSANSSTATEALITLPIALAPRAFGALIPGALPGCITLPIHGTQRSRESTTQATSLGWPYLALSLAILLSFLPEWIDCVRVILKLYATYVMFSMTSRLAWSSDLFVLVVLVKQLKRIGEAVAWVQAVSLAEVEGVILWLVVGYQVGIILVIGVGTHSALSPVLAHIELIIKGCTRNVHWALLAVNVVVRPTWKCADIVAATVKGILISIKRIYRNVWDV